MLQVEEATPEQRFQRDLASDTLTMDFLKHIATLSAGSIVVLVGFWDKTGAEQRWLLGAAMTLFALSVLGTVMWQLQALLGMTNDVIQIDFGRRSMRYFAGASVLCGLGGFAAGMVVLVAFAIANL